MKNIGKFLGIIAAVAVIGLFAGCGEPDAADRIEISISGLPTTANGYFAIVSLYDKKDDIASVARSSVAKPISGATTTSEMMQSGKNFAKEGNYFVRLEIYNSETSETVDRRLYDGMTSANQGIVKGTNQLTVGQFTPSMNANLFPPIDTPAPDNYGTYTGEGWQTGVTETIVLSLNSFYISDAVPVVDFIDFKINKWEEIPVPTGTAYTGYTGGYKFTGRILDGKAVNAASGNTPKNIYGNKTAPGFDASDMDKSGNGPDCWMSIYFKVDETKGFTFIRTAFSKAGNLNETLITTTDNTTVRVYTKKTTP